ncbi:n-acetyltransferase domain-containing protein [Nephila pilipes]|uniref:N-acetyltransferase domain-containing protein n=1 Tax=Nephila pilipes TaxID=299642 RepID=A0A8X6QPV9_NEPPI|nr:n-acetyltransferase domain-containing protein [Nephila pilipes]
MEVTIRNATPSDLPSIVELAKSVNRMISPEEIQSWMLKDPQALFLAEISNPTEAKNRLVGACCGTILDSDLGFMGLYIVKEDIRGKGIGSKLWKATKDHLGDRNIGVRGKRHNLEKYKGREGFEHIQDYVIEYYESFFDSVPSSVAWSPETIAVQFFEGKLVSYRKNCDDVVVIDSSKERCQIAEPKSIGFASKEATLVEDIGKCESSETRFDGNAETIRSSRGLLSDDSVLKSEDGGDENELITSVGGTRSSDVQTSTLNTNQKSIDRCLNAEVIMSKVVEYDKSLHDRDRSVEVRQTFSWSSCKSSVALADGRVVGYGCFRLVLTGHWIISPFYADTETIAEIILFDLLRGFDFAEAPEGIVIRLPDKNSAAKRLVNKFGFSEIEGEHIMTGFTKRSVVLDISRIYSFHSTVFCCE